MPVNIRVANVKNHLELWTDVPEEDGGGRDLDGVTKALGFASIRTGIPRITEGNVDEVLRRVQALEGVYGALMNQGAKNLFFTRDDIVRRIGMTVNAAPITKRDFDASIRRAQKNKF